MLALDSVEGGLSGPGRLWLFSRASRPNHLEGWRRQAYCELVHSPALSGARIKQLYAWKSRAFM